MAWSFTLYSIPPLVAAILSAVLVAVAWQNRDRPIAQPFGALMLAVGAWSLVYAVQLGFQQLSAQVFWWRVGISIGGAIPTIWLVLAVFYSGGNEWLTRGAMAALAVDPGLFTYLVWTNESHGLIWRDVSLGTAPTVAEFVFGPGYLLHIAYAYLLVLAGIGLLIGVYLRASRIYRTQAGLLVAGALVPLGANVAFTMGIGPVPELDLTTFSFTATGTVYAFTLFRFELLNLAPVAHENMIDELGDGVLVLDVDDRIRDYNTNAAAIIDDSLEIGRPADRVLSHDLEEIDGRVITAEPNGGRRFYQVRVSPVYDFQDHLAGRLVALRDVTGRKEYEQRLEVANRVLRHNLRNDMGIILGRAELLADEVSGEPGDHIRTIQRTAHEVMELSEKASRIEAAVDAGKQGEVPVDVVDIVDRVTGTYADRHPDADIDVEIEDAGSRWVAAIDDDLLRSALANVVENAIEHNDAPEPTVDVTVDHGQSGDCTEIHVADDGPGIPEVEYEVLAAGGESDLEHGSGLGLWLVYWIVSASGGEVHFDDNDPRGSVVTIELEPASPPGAPP